MHPNKLFNLSKAIGVEIFGVDIFMILQHALYHGKPHAMESLRDLETSEALSMDCNLLRNLRACMDILIASGNTTSSPFTAAFVALDGTPKINLQKAV